MGSASDLLRTALVSTLSGVLGGLVVWYAMRPPAAPPPEHRVVEAGRLQLQDQAGAVLVEARADDQGGYLQLQAAGAAQPARIMLGATSTDGVLSFVDVDGRIRLAAGVESDGEPFVRLFDAQGQQIWRAGRTDEAPGAPATPEPETESPAGSEGDPGDE